MNEDKKEVLASSSFKDSVKEVIETGKSSQLDKVLANMNNQLKSKLYIEIKGKGADILFRVVNKISDNEGDILTSFNNIIVLAEIIMNTHSASEDKVYLMHICQLIQLREGKEPTTESIIVEIIRSIASQIEGDGEFRLKCNHKYFDCLTELGVM